MKRYGGRKLIEPKSSVILANDAHAIARDVTAALRTAGLLRETTEPTNAQGDARDHLHAKCDCVPGLGPAHCHLCGDAQGSPVQWAECSAVRAALTEAPATSEPNQSETKSNEVLGFTDAQIEAAAKALFAIEEPDQNAWRWDREQPGAGLAWHDYWLNAARAALTAAGFEAAHAKDIGTSTEPVKKGADSLHVSAGAGAPIPDPVCTECGLDVPDCVTHFDVGEGSCVVEDNRTAPHPVIDEGKLAEAIAPQLGAAIHTGLRKVCDSFAANDAWYAIGRMPDSEWNDLTSFVAEIASSAVTSKLRDEAR